MPTPAEHYIDSAQQLVKQAREHAVDSEANSSMLKEAHVDAMCAVAEATREQTRTLKDIQRMLVQRLPH